MLSKAILGSLEPQVNGLKDVENQVWRGTILDDPWVDHSLWNLNFSSVETYFARESLGYLNFNEMADFVNHTADCGGVVMNHRVIQPAET